MEIITLKINTQTKTGKTLLALMDIFSKEKKGVEILSASSNRKAPNAETRKTFEDTDKGIGLTKTESHEDLMEKLFS